MLLTTFALDVNVRSIIITPRVKFLPPRSCTFLITESDLAYINLPPNQGSTSFPLVFQSCVVCRLKDSDEEI